MIIPFWTSFLIRTIAWRIVLAPTGSSRTSCRTSGCVDTPIQLLDTREAVQLGVVYNYLPLMIFPLFVALDRLDPALREASKDLGANRVRDLPPGHVAARRAGHRGRAAARLHPARR